MTPEEIFERFPVVAMYCTGNPGNQDAYHRFTVRMMAGENNVAPESAESSVVPLIVSVCYEWKDAIEKLTSAKKDLFGWPLIQLTQASLDLKDSLWQPRLRKIPAVSLQPLQPKADYLKCVKAIQSHIQRGDVYEMNYCTELYAEQVQVNPLQVFERLCIAAPAPFSVLYKWHHLWLICASPERFLARRGERLISQPIKGTAPRHAVAEEDRKAAERLSRSAKESMENTMIVDLVRNDLSRVCRPGTVKVSEWCGIYSFSHVHQMISTIEGKINPNQTFENILKAAFPPGSMTGAPKIKAMELAEKYEKSRRGLYSGCVGYWEPDGTFDLNVVIRSLIYNEKTGYLSCHVGSAITHLSDPEQEWEECQWKSAALRQVLSQ